MLARGSCEEGIEELCQERAVVVVVASIVGAMNTHSGASAIPDSLSVYRSNSPSSNISDDGSVDSFEYAASVVAAASEAGSTDSKRGLPFNVEKQLVVDIQASGGLDNCSLSQITDAKPDIYGRGKKGSTEAEQKRLKQVRNKVNDWKTKPSVVNSTTTSFSATIQTHHRDQAAPRLLAHPISLARRPLARHRLLARRLLARRLLAPLLLYAPSRSPSPSVPSLLFLPASPSWTTLCSPTSPRR